MSDDFVVTPMPDQFVKSEVSGGPGEYDGCKNGAFGEFPRTKSPNAVPEKTLDGRIPDVSGESDQY